MGDSEKRVLAFIGNNPKGVSVAEIKKELPQQNMQDIVSALNHLIMQELITLYELPKQPGDKNKRLIYKINTASNVEGLRCADNEEKVVYRIIEESSNKGIWVRDIRIKANLALLALNKVIKSLENKKMIKSVKTVTAGKKKVYMLYNLEPDRSLTGGAWYSDQDFESDFVDALNQGCYRILKQKRDTAKKLAGGPLAVNNHSYASVTDVCKYINELGLSKIPLSDDDIKQILTTLLYDGKVERKLVAGNELFKAVEPFLPSPGFVRTTCGVCPAERDEHSKEVDEHRVECGKEGTKYACRVCEPYCHIFTHSGCMKQFKSQEALFGHVDLGCPTPGGRGTPDHEASDGE